MKIEINVDASNIGETVLDIFKNLKEEDKHNIALQIVKNYILEDPKIERSLEEDKILQALKLDPYNKNKSDSELRTSYSFIESCKKIIISKETMVKELTMAAINTYKQEVINLVKEDVFLKEAFEKIRTEVIRDYPDMVKETMMKVVSDAFSSMFQTGLNNASRLSNIETNLQQLLNNGR